MRMSHPILAVPVALCALAALSLPSQAAASPGLFQVQAQVCSNLIPIGLLPPSSGFTAGCSRRFVLKLGASIGPDGNYILLAYPDCGSGPCTGQTGTTALQCQAASGYDCCLASAEVVNTTQGTNVSFLSAGINQRIGLDTDQRAGICFSDYSGNGARMVNVSAIQFPGSDRTQAAITGFLTLFITSPPAGSNQATTLMVEFLALDATATQASSWGQLKLHYR